MGNDSRLVLEDGSIYAGRCFGSEKSVSGEVVFNTGMVGYPETLTDPSYRGQILVLTYPLVGNYGVPEDSVAQGLSDQFESDRIQVAGLVVSEVSWNYSHWSARRSLEQWLSEQDVPALCDVDTRALTKRLRENGTMLGKILNDNQEVSFYDPNAENVVSQVSVKAPVVYEAGKSRVVLIDCGCKNSIIHSLLSRGVTVIRVPWNYDFLDENFDGVVISNGPGDPKVCIETIGFVRRVMDKNCPILGICLGHQLLALAAHGDTYKLRYGHRSQNQPCTEIGTKRCYITSQNHGYAVRTESLGDDWRPWFVNTNDRTNEGIQHGTRPFCGVQFHPEASPGPVDTNILFDEFIKKL